MTRSNALLHARLLADRKLLRGRVRECAQWCASEPYMVYRWDLAYRDPASGRVAQYGVEGWVREDETMEETLAERIRPPAIAALARELERKCGIAEALKNQVPLSLPRGAPARMV